jgi:tetratricopeptide (TPR) repeat protein
MQRAAGDSLYADAVSAIDRASASGGSQLRELAEGHRDYAAASALFSDDRFVAAAPGFVGAIALWPQSFCDPGSASQGAIAYVTGRAPEATKVLENTLASARSKGYAYAAGRSTWFLGLLAMARGDFGDARFQYEETLDLFERMGDVEQAGAAHNLLAVMQDYLGDALGAWQHRVIAFESLSASKSLRFVSTRNRGSAIKAESPETALTIENAALAIATQWQRAGAVAETLSQRASILAALNRFEDADRDLREAQDHFARVPDPAFRSRLQVALLNHERSETSSRPSRQWTRRRRFKSSNSAAIAFVSRN